MDPGVLELSAEHLRGGGEFTCHAQNPLGSQHISLSLSLQRKSEPMPQVVLVAIGEVAVKILLLGLCLILLRVRSPRKRAARPAVGVELGNSVTG
nr:sialic acid-binding Ig-like lectin 13 isoform X2 [Marmota flaviventris]